MKDEKYRKYVIEKEFSERVPKSVHGKPQWMVRVDGDFFGSYETKAKAEAAVRAFEKARMSNPAPRIGAAKPKRASAATGKKPTMRLVQRRAKNTKPGYYPNPVDRGMRYLVSVSPVGKQGVNPDGSRNFKTVAAFVVQALAVEYAKKLAAAHPSWTVKVEKE